MLPQTPLNIMRRHLTQIWHMFCSSTTKSRRDTVDGSGKFNLHNLSKLQKDRCTFYADKVCKYLDCAKKETNLLQISVIFAKGYLLSKVSCYEGSHKVFFFRSPAGDQRVARLKEIMRILPTCASSEYIEVHVWDKRLVARPTLPLLTRHYTQSLPICTYNQDS